MPFRVSVALVPVRWAAVEAELAEHPLELYAMRWLREGVKPGLRRSLAELTARSGRFSAAERSGAVLAACLLVVLALVILKAVHS